jgi:protein TonB
MKKIYCLIIIGFCFCTVAKAQVKVNDTISVKKQHTQTAPEFPGGQKAFYAYIISALRSKQAIIEFKGKVIVTFIVDTDGDLSNIKIKQGIEDGLNLAVIQILQDMPLWTPGTQDGKPVKAQYTLPITF